MKKQIIENIFQIWQHDNPNPRTELIYSNEFELLVAVVLSAQATDVSVNKATAGLFKVANSPESILQLGEEGLIEYIKSIGLFRSKARHVVALSQQLIDDHQGQVPNTKAALVKLPGVGVKTANVVLNELFDVPTIAVDTHIFRVANRIGFAPGNTVGEVETRLMKVVPITYRLKAHHWMILHGRYVCIARKPKCEVCKIQQYCQFVDKT